MIVDDSVVETLLRPPVIGLVGRAGSGKDTICGFIREMLPTARRLAFADALKDELASVLGVDRSFIDQNKHALRGLLQTYGTDYRRQFSGEDYWVRQAEASLKDCLEEGVSPVVFTDVRFENEAELVKNCGGILLLVQRPVASTRSHASEDLPDKIDPDYTLWNRDSLDDLRLRVRVFLKAYGYL